jgi:hypothetical protein
MVRTPVEKYKKIRRRRSKQSDLPNCVGDGFKSTLDNHN